MRDINIRKSLLLVFLVITLLLIEGCSVFDKFEHEKITESTRCNAGDGKDSGVISIAYEEGVNEKTDLYMVEIRAIKSKGKLSFNTIEINLSDDYENDTFFYLLLSDQPRSNKFSAEADHEKYYYAIFFANKKKLDGTFCAQANYLYDRREGIGVESYPVLLKIK